MTNKELRQFLAPDALEDYMLVEMPDGKCVPVIPAQQKGRNDMEMIIEDEHESDEVILAMKAAGVPVVLWSNRPGARH